MKHNTGWAIASLAEGGGQKKESSCSPPIKISQKIFLPENLCPRMQSLVLKAFILERIEAKLKFSPLGNLQISVRILFKICSVY